MTGRYVPPIDPLGPDTFRGKIVTPPTDRSSYRHLPIVLVNDTHTGFWSEKYNTFSDDFSELLTESKSLIVTDNSAGWADSTAHLRKEHKCFDYHIGRSERSEYIEGLAGDDDLELIYETEWCLGWGTSRKLLTENGIKSGHYRETHPWHYVLDPTNFFGLAHLGLLPDQDSLYRWAKEYRDWCKQRDIAIAPSKGAAGGKILRTLVTEAQCKIPRQTNNAVRPYLCASHIRSFTAPREVIETAVEYDQKGAYHECAKTIHFPDRDNFLAKGDYHDLSEIWWEAGSPEFSDLCFKQNGVLICSVKICDELEYREQYPFSPFMPWTGEPIAIWTNELSLVGRLGLTIVGVIAAWTSPNISKELATHALLSQKELVDAKDVFVKQWLKPMNLAVYGVSASLVRPIRRRTIDGFKKDVPMFERSTNHVAWLGMLQAEVRKRSIMLAMDLDMIGARIVSIYADAVFVETYNLDVDGLVPRYFGSKQHHKLRTRNNVIISNESLKVPGVSLDDPERGHKAREYVNSS